MKNKRGKRSQKTKNSDRLNSEHPMGPTSYFPLRILGLIGHFTISRSKLSEMTNYSWRQNSYEMTNYKNTYTITSYRSPFFFNFRILTRFDLSLFLRYEDYKKTFNYNYFKSCRITPHRACISALFL